MRRPVYHTVTTLAAFAGISGQCVRNYLTARILIADAETADGRPLFSESCASTFVDSITGG